MNILVAFADGVLEALLRFAETVKIAPDVTSTAVRRSALPPVIFVRIGEPPRNSAGRIAIALEVSAVQT